VRLIRNSRSSQRRERHEGHSRCSWVSPCSPERCRIYSRRLAIGAAWGLLASAALAEGSVSYTSVEATADKPVQLSCHASAHRGNCSGALAQAVRVTEPPKGGALVVRSEVVFYQAHSGYTGPDHQVTNENGEVATYDVKITVKEGAGPSAPNGRGGERAEQTQWASIGVALKEDTRLLPCRLRVVAPTSLVELWDQVRNGA
jgi:hypothetical protein